MQGVILGGREGIRTLGLSVANAALSQLSYAPTLQTAICKYNTRTPKRQSAPTARLCGNKPLGDLERIAKLRLIQPAALREVAGATTLASNLG